MLLQDKYFRVLRTEPTADGGATFSVELLADCDVYRGHFPHKPVSPGVCNIEMIKECASLLAGRRLLIDSIKQCRLTAVASPEVCPRLEVKLLLTPTDASARAYTVVATIADGNTDYMTLKGELSSH